ncbi:hypothetical protein GLOIN_2v1870045 [Rhizophagus irregularis DAOM 181602=DAOM 197198]|nr:hypothetical protein GLOIN_2v1870045 [Rhizophagus irregularis DAOM 181602=DAOM 197198]
MSYGQKHKKIQILFCDLSYVDVCISEGIVIDEELMAYADEYLVLEVFEKDYSYSDRAFSKANNKRYQQPEYRNIAPFVAEIMEMCCIGAWSPLGALMV